MAAPTTTAVNVFVRVRELDSRGRAGSESSPFVTVRTLWGHKEVLLSNGRAFSFDEAGGEDAKQSDVFEVVGRPTLEAFLEGYNGTILCYGQTGSGKTYTMTGPTGGLGGDERGLLPRLLEEVFGELSRRQEESPEEAFYRSWCSHLEIHNEHITDLLAASSGPSAQLRVREAAERGTFVEGLREVRLQSAGDALRALASGTRRRTVAATAMNETSSRSHAVFTLRLERVAKAASGQRCVRTSQLHLVDLAGSERQTRASRVVERSRDLGFGATSLAAERTPPQSPLKLGRPISDAVPPSDSSTAGGSLTAIGGSEATEAPTAASRALLQEACSINRSLSALSGVIYALNAGRSHVPYRDSKLTMLLRDSLGGSARTWLVAAVNPALSCRAETLSTLLFAQRAQQVHNRATIQPERLVAEAEVVNLLAAEAAVPPSTPTQEAARAEANAMTPPLKWSSTPQSSEADFALTLARAGEARAAAEVTVMIKAMTLAEGDAVRAAAEASRATAEASRAAAEVLSERARACMSEQAAREASAWSARADARVLAAKEEAEAKVTAAKEEARAEAEDNMAAAKEEAHARAEALVAEAEALVAAAREEACTMAEAKVVAAEAEAMKKLELANEASLMTLQSAVAAAVAEAVSTANMQAAARMEDALARERARASVELTEAVERAVRAKDAELAAAVSEATASGRQLAMEEVEKAAHEASDVWERRAAVERAEAVALAVADARKEERAVAEIARVKTAAAAEAEKAAAVEMATGAASQITAKMATEADAVMEAMAAEHAIAMERTVAEHAAETEAKLLRLREEISAEHAAETEAKLLRLKEEISAEHATQVATQVKQFQAEMLSLKEQVEAEAARAATEAARAEAATELRKKAVAEREEEAERARAAADGQAKAQARAIDADGRRAVAEAKAAESAQQVEQLEEELYLTLGTASEVEAAKLAAAANELEERSMQLRVRLGPGPPLPALATISCHLPSHVPRCGPLAALPVGRAHPRASAGFGCTGGTD